MPASVTVKKDGLPEYPWTIRITGGRYYDLTWRTRVRTFDDAIRVVRTYLDSGWFLGYPEL